VKAGEAGGLQPGKSGPSLERFEVEAGTKDAHLKNVYWTKWSDALVETGYQPKLWGAPRKSDEELLIRLAALTRDLKKFRRRTKSSSPTTTGQVPRLR
jgi:hypothetical protein